MALSVKFSKVTNKICLLHSIVEKKKTGEFFAAKIVSIFDLPNTEMSRDSQRTNQ